MQITILDRNRHLWNGRNTRDIRTVVLIRGDSGFEIAHTIANATDGNTGDALLPITSPRSRRGAHFLTLDELLMWLLEVAPHPDDYQCDDSKPQDYPSLVKPQTTVH